MLRRLNKIYDVPFKVDVAILILRVGISLLMLTHGYSKFEKILHGDFSFGDPLGMGAGLSLILTTFAEFFCSILVIFGLFTRPALIFLMFTMMVVVFIVKGGQGIAEMERGLLFLIPYISLFILGPGRLSMDAQFFRK
ncbi:DoxX family protein [Marinilongibacter aquaticus]|uniref:DoxX family protein n=1 Tax=Marinilongibacter aquaticus TaxID=2975157 RepID=UPI0021BDCFD9|nr:DoxX family protein [Marinilongibacter aquaticus]UBM58944.1 DoxX family protein [Marinilongibacter aquaticus]